MNKFSPRYQNRLIIFFVCVPLWTAFLAFLGYFLFSVKTEEISIIIAIDVVISILYSQWSSIILKNQSLVISYISGGIPYRHVVSVNQIENIIIYYKKTCQRFR